MQSSVVKGQLVPAADWPKVSLLELGALPTAVPCGRLHARHVLREWLLGHLAADAELLVSELLSNAVTATRSAGETELIALRLLASPHQLLIEVWDRSPAVPRPREADDDAENGRGLAVIEALSHRWGFRHVSADLKVVWCELLISDR